VIDFRLTPDEAEALRRALIGKGVLVAVLRLTPDDTEEDLLRLLAHAAQFPIYFAGDWDAAEAALLDVAAYGDASGLVVMLVGSLTPGFERLADAIVHSAPRWNEAGKFVRMVLT